MAHENPPKRTYTSSRRKEQARQTRLQIITAARKLFTERGYAGATLGAIAGEAGVADETVYAIFGNKRAILSQLIDISVVGDDLPVPLLQRPGPQAVAHEPDPQRQIQLFAKDITEIMGRMAPIFEIMRVAAKTEPEILEMLRAMLGNRFQGMAFFIQSIAANHALSADLSSTEAAETVWAISSAEVYNLLTIDRGWTAEQYQGWLEKSLTRLLLQAAQAAF